MITFEHFSKQRCTAFRQALQAQGSLLGRGLNTAVDVPSDITSNFTRLPTGYRTIRERSRDSNIAHFLVFDHEEPEDTTSPQRCVGLARMAFGLPFADTTAHFVETAVTYGQIDSRRIYAVTLGTLAAAAAINQQRKHPDLYLAVVSPGRQKSSGYELADTITYDQNPTEFTFDTELHRKTWGLPEPWEPNPKYHILAPTFPNPHLR